MTYTICLDLFIDQDEIISEEDISDFLKESMSSASIDIKNVRLLDIND